MLSPLGNHYILEHKINLYTRPINPYTLFYRTPCLGSQCVCQDHWMMVLYGYGMLLSVILLQEPIVMSHCLFLDVLWHVYFTHILLVCSCHVSIHAAVKTQDPFSPQLSSILTDNDTACGRRSIHPSLIMSSPQLNT